MLKKLVPFLSVILLAGPVFAADAPPFAHSHASSASASDTGLGGAQPPRWNRSNQMLQRPVVGGPFLATPLSRDRHMTVIRSI
jgi:hypothetical protein